MALVRVSAHEISDFQRVMRAVATTEAPGGCRHAAMVRNAYTQWMIRSGVSEADPTSDADFDAAFFPPALDVLFAQAVTIFSSGVCDTLSPLELRQLEAACAWALGTTGISFGIVGVAVGVVGLGLAAWSLFGRRGKRR